MRHEVVRSVAVGSILLSLFGGGRAFAYSAVPVRPTGSIALERTALSISFNPRHHQADWVFYELGPDQLQNCVQRSDAFRPDPDLPSSVGASLADYRGSGFDRGHLSPAGDNKWSREAMHESFLLSNISPQPAAFNRGIWAKVENLVRAWAKAGVGLWVATGPVLTGRHLATIGDGEVSVPESFYKVLVTKDAKRAIALELPTDARGNLQQYALSVRSVEEDTGLRFLGDIPAARELANDLDARPWNFDADFDYDDCRGTGAYFGANQPGTWGWFNGPGVGE